MLNTKLIVLDGLPGSGKTTTAKWLTSQLHQHGVETYWFQETDIAHPLWWYEFWNGTNYLPPDFDNTPVDRFIENSLAKWRDFVFKAEASEQVYIAESVFFQNAIAMFLMGGAESAQLIDYAHKVQQLAQGLNPALIYFYQNDISEAARKVCSLRGKEFTEELFNNMEQFPYLKQRKLKGLHGVTVLWREIRKLTDVLFAEYTIPKLGIENTTGDWSTYYEKVLGFLGFNALPSKEC